MSALVEYMANYLWNLCLNNASSIVLVIIGILIGFLFIVCMELCCSRQETET